MDADNNSPAIRYGRFQVEMKGQAAHCLPIQRNVIQNVNPSFPGTLMCGVRGDDICDQNS